VSDKVEKNRKKQAVKSRPALSEEEVRDYLLLNPDFFDLNSDLLTLLKPTRVRQPGDIVDFQAVLLDRLQSEVARLGEMQGSLIHASRSNMTTQARIHAAVLCLLEADDFEHLCHIIGNDWVDMLQVDSIAICFESLAEKPLPQNPDIRPLEAGTVNRFLGHENSAILRGDVTAAEEIFGPATSLVKAEALIRIEESDRLPPGILAFGSRDKDCFAPGQGTELLRFLAAAFHSRVKKLIPAA